MRALVAIAATLLAGCAVTPAPYSDAEDPEISLAVHRSATPQRIAVCYGYGCRRRAVIDIEDAWPRIAALFSASVKNAEQERAAIAEAIGLFEQSAGRQLGTSADLAGTPFRLNDPTQLDCIDEAINSSSMLHLLERRGLLRWHEVGEPARRYAFLVLGIHYTAVIVERHGRARYAVDSWFHANGHAAEVVELERWRAGWAPPTIHTHSLERPLHGRSAAGAEPMSVGR